MSAASAQAQIPILIISTGTGSARVSGLADFLVDPGRYHLVHADRLAHVLEGPLAEALEHEVYADLLGGRRPHDDLAALRRARDARGDVRRRTARREHPSRAELRRTHERLARVDPHVQLDRRKDPPVLFVELFRALADGE